MNKGEDDNYSYINSFKGIPYFPYPLISFYIKNNMPPVSVHLSFTQPSIWTREANAVDCTLQQTMMYDQLQWSKGYAVPYKMMKVCHICLRFPPKSHPKRVLFILCVWCIQSREWQRVAWFKHILFTTGHEKLCLALSRELLMRVCTDYSVSNHLFSAHHCTFITFCSQFYLDEWLSFSPWMFTICI